MKNSTILSKLNRLKDRLNGCVTEYDISTYMQTVREIIAKKISLSSKSNEELQAMSLVLIQKAKISVSLDTLLVEAYALVYESIHRIMDLTPFNVQLIGAIVLHQGKIAEMKTGEGKTLTSVFPAYLNAISGKGVHVLTFNDYLAKRDALWMKPVYEFLGLHVTYIQEGMGAPARTEAYKADITYITAKEAGFDYLRDGLCMEKDAKVQKKHNVAIIDEADSILIDESRIPLVIAGAARCQNSETTADQTRRSIASLVRTLTKNIDFQFDEYGRNVFFTNAGLKRIEENLACGSLYEGNNFETLSLLHYALHAEYLLFRDKDYIVRNNAVELVDEFTGRVAYKRQWPHGLQAAIEAKEQCIPNEKGRILNSITLQHFLTLYPKISGMTATAQRSEEELRIFYNLPVVVIPPNIPCIRKDFPDIVFKTKQQKYAALIDEIKTVHTSQRPILVGTSTVTESVTLANLLKCQGIVCNVLNAKEDAFEAEIISRAGMLCAVTIATNMAGRGTDIRLGGSCEEEKQKVAKLGGLYVIGTNRHESKRIDDQLRGRSARQGDEGSSRFFISLEDDLFVKYRLKDLIPPRLVSNNENGVLSHPIVNKEIDRVQRIIEGQNLELKKTLAKYTVLLEGQRNIVMELRHDILVNSTAYHFFRDNAPSGFEKMYRAFDKETLQNICTGIFLTQLDDHWANYCAEINDIKDNIHLRRWGKQDPVFEFQKIIIDSFIGLVPTIQNDAIKSFSKLANAPNFSAVSNIAFKAPSSTWTYLVNDDPMGDNFALAFAGDIGFSAWAGLLWPLTMMFFLLRRKNKQQ